jgi:hypothetical protein
VSELPRILTIMGSGETAPTMVKIHRSVLERLGPPPVPAVLLDTPFGFQENAKELAQRVVHYFDESLHTAIDVASTPLADLEPGEAGPTGAAFAEERLVSSVRSARYVFAGPGSPTYALRRWRGTVVPSLLHEKLRNGGAISFASAAALTLGVRTVPVYEIYKVGQDPHWLEGLDLLAEAGLSAAVIPHYNNAEGGTHDTRFCYLGERRLSMLEAELPESAFVLGVDEHTSLTLDLGTGVGTVGGIGVVTVRAAGRSQSFESGSRVSIEEILATARALADDRAGGGAPVMTPPEESRSSGPTSAEAYSGSPLVSLVHDREAAFSAAISGRDVPTAVAAILELEAQITEWSHDIPAGDALDRARASLRSLVVDLGHLAETGARDPRDLVGPFVETMLELRAKARADRRFDDADWVRDRLSDLGVEVRDAAGSSEWLLRDGEAAQ